MSPGETLLDRTVRAVDRVRERLRRAAAALEAAGVPYAVAGGNAVAAWVARVDPAAVRNTQGVHILLRRALVRMKLTSFRDKDRTHLRDLLDVGLIDPTWPDRFAPELAASLRQLIDTPEG